MLMLCTMRSCIMNKMLISASLFLITRVGWLQTRRHEFEGGGAFIEKRLAINTKTLQLLVA